MRLTIRTNLASRILMYCAVNAARTVRATDIATACNASGNHVSQVIHKLQQNGFVKTLRGRSGGLKLNLMPSEISMGRVFRIFESGVPFAECFDQETNTCPLVADCRLRTYIERALEAFYHELDLVTLDDMVRGNCGLSALLAMRPDTMPDCKAAPDRFALN